MFRAKAGSLPMLSAAFVLFSASLLFAPAALGAQANPQPQSNAQAQADSIETYEASGREGHWIRSIQAALVAEQFDELDQQADRYRADKTRMPGGNLRLNVFYSALDSPQKTDQDTLDHLAHIEHWISARPQSITARVAMAASLVRWAWVARGNGEANTVTPEGWRLFNQRAAKARSVLEAAAQLKATCPVWYNVMMTLALAQDWTPDLVKRLFEQGVAADPDDFYLYRQYANYLLPKWDGKPGDASAFAKASADSVGGDAGDELYYRIATVLIRRGDGDFPVSEMDWARIQRGFQSIVARYGVTVRLNNEIAFMAWKYHDGAFASKQFGVIGDAWSRGVWGNRQRFDRARDWAQSHAS